MKTKEQKDKDAKNRQQSLISVTRRFNFFSISKIYLTPPPIILTPILAQWWIWRPPPFLDALVVSQSVTHFFSDFQIINDNLVFKL